MSPVSPTQPRVPSRSPSFDASHPYGTDLQYPPSGSESASPPPDSPAPDRYTPPRLDLKSAVPHGASQCLPSYSPSPTDSEFFPQDDHGMPLAHPPHVHTIPVIPTLLPMSALMPDTATERTAGKPQPVEDYRFPLPQHQTGPSRTRAKSFSTGPSSPIDLCPPFDPTHPYARIHPRNQGAKRRKMWNHALEKSLFTPQEISTMGAPNRRTIYTASLEAHIDQLHAQLLSYALFPVPFEKLDCFRGLNTKTAKSMVAGLHRDATELRMKRLELERAMHGLRAQLYTPPSVPPPYPRGQMHGSHFGMRRHSLD